MKLIFKTKIGKEEHRRCLAGKRLGKIPSQGWQLWTWTLAISTDQLLSAWKCPCHSLWNHIHKDNLGSGWCLCYSSNTSTGILRSLKFSVNIKMEGLQDLRTACYFTRKCQFIIWWIVNCWSVAFALVAWQEMYQAFVTYGWENSSKLHCCLPNINPKAGNYHM